ncbi:MAG TPA: beta-1,6-N-acetylglucosaminyltransferase [Ferruginibacter sp.]|nr:beta-1,6-N-acetylglucosaminyltransferase [Ferruginibacter sp.]
MKLAHLILAHKDPLQLERLVKRLSHPGVEIYVQLDAKADLKKFDYLEKQPNVFFIKNRVKIYWGSYSIIQATLNGFEEILATGNTYSHINLLSGQDYPLQNNNCFLDFLSKNPGKTFMHSLSIDQEWQEAQPRIRQYHFDDFMFRGRFSLQRIINFILPLRKMPAGLKPYGRSQWFTITPESTSYIIDFIKNNPAVRRYFRMTWGPDEFFFQTILHNSPFKDNIVNDNLRYINFKQGEHHPQTLTMADADELVKSGKFFGRKFNAEEDSDILNYMDVIAENTSGQQFKSTAP